MLQSSLGRSIPSMEQPDMVHSSPLDLSLLSQDELDRASDSPLDLSLKTRKRCADTTKVDDDVIFIAHRTLEKRLCYDKIAETYKRQHYISPGQNNSWNGWKNDNSLSDKQDGHSEEKYFSDLFHKRSLSYKEIKRTIHGAHSTSTVARESEYSHNDISANNPFNSNMMGVLSGQHYKQPWGTYEPGLQPYGNAKPGIQAYDNAKSRTSYSSTNPTPTASPQNIYHRQKQTPSFNQSPLPSVTIHHHNQMQQYIPQQTFPFNTISTESSPCVKVRSPRGSTGFNKPSPCVIPTTQCVTQPFLSPQSQHVLYGYKNFAGSELKAALSSSGRFYPNQTPGRITVDQSLKPALPLPQRCSPDSTFLSSKSNLSSASVCFQETASLSTYSSPIYHTAGYTLPKPKSGPAITIEDSPKRYQIRSHEMQGWAKSPTPNVQTVSNSPRSMENYDGSQSTELLTENSKVNEPPPNKQLVVSCNEVLHDLIDKGFNQTTKYKTPFHIAIPSEKKTQNTDENVTKKDQTASLSRHPKLRCKKHIILNAYSQEEELKNLNKIEVLKTPCSGRPHSVSPSERPSSPKMPILSPQHQLPPVLASQCVNDPPPLRPTTEVTVEDDDDLQCPSISGETVSPYISEDVLPYPSLNNCADLLTQQDVANHNKTNTIDPTEKKVHKIPNLSAFVETGVAPPLDLKPRNTWSSSQLNPGDFISWKLQNLQKEPELTAQKTECKLMPGANGVPILKEPIEDTNKRIKTVYTFDSIATCKLNKNEAVDLQAEITAYKTSLRMPAKLISKRPPFDEKRTGIAEEFGACSSRFRHLENSGDSGNPQSAPLISFCAEEITEVSKNNSISEVESEKDDTKCDSDRNIWSSLSLSSETDPVRDNRLQLSESNSLKTTDNIPKQKTKFPVSKTTWRLPPRRFLFARIAEKFRAKRRLALSDEKFDSKSSGLKKKRRRRHRRSMLDEIANSDGFVTEQRLERANSSKVDLFADPALLSREERALQKAMLRFTEMETGTFRKTPHQKRQSNTQRKAYQLKRKAMRSSPNSKGIKTSPGKKGFVDFQPEVLPSRTRMQSKGVHSVGGYNRDAAYEEELVKDDRRKQLKRARRRARKMGDRRANARKLRREQNTPSLQKSKENYPKTEVLNDIAGSPRKSLKGLKCCVTTDGNAIQKKVSTVPIMRPNCTKTMLSLDELDELPDLVGGLTSYVSEDKDPSFIIPDVHPLTGPKLLTDLKQERVHMKLSWRPVTAANKGKPRMATVRISHKQGSGANSVRMIKLRRRAKQTYQQTSQWQQKSHRQRTKRCRERDNIPSTSTQCSDTASPPMILRSKLSTNKKRMNNGSDLLVRLRRRLKKGSGVKSAGSRKAHSHHHPSFSRYPLRDLATKKADFENDGYTTEEYDIEDDQNYVHSRVDRGRRLDEVGWKGLPERFPEPPDLPKLSVNKNAGETALHRAARLGYEEVVQYLLNTESEDVNSRDNAGYTALHEGCIGDHIAIVANLLSHRSNPNVSSLDGVRPIQNAMENGNFEMTRLLLSYGADPILDNTPNISRDILGFVENYMKDINGYPDGKEESSWRFYGSTLLDDLNGVEHNLFTNVPSDDEDETLEDIFECSQSKQFVSYRLKVPEAEREDNYVLLADILERYEMSRGMFLQELGIRVRIYSLSRQTLEEEIEQASTAFPALSDEIKELQTIEVIKLVDVQFVINHRLRFSNGKTMSSDQLKENNNLEAITGSSSLSKTRPEFSDQDLVYPCGMASRALSRSVSDLSAPEHFQLPKINRSPRTVRLSREAHIRPNKSKALTKRLNSPRRGKPGPKPKHKHSNSCDNLNNNCLNSPRRGKPGPKPKHKHSNICVNLNYDCLNSPRRGKPGPKPKHKHSNICDNLNNNCLNSPRRGKPGPKPKHKHSNICVNLNYNCLNSPRRGKPGPKPKHKHGNICDNLNNNCSKDNSNIANCNAIQDSKSSYCLKTRRTLSFLSYEEDKLTDICSDGIVQDIKNNNSRCATTTLCNDTNRSFIDR